VGIARHFAMAPATRLWARAVGFGAAIQLVLGVLSILLGAPGWLQLGHLLMAQLLWISAVLLGWAWALSPPALGSPPELVASQP
jgi:heme A synthase